MTTVIYAGLEQFNGRISKILTVEYWDLTLRLSVTAVLIMKYINDFLPYRQVLIPVTHPDYKHHITNEFFIPTIALPVP